MHYQGGKNRIAKHIAPIINETPGDVYIEPFVGGGSVMAQIQKPTRIAVDIIPDLIMLYQALQNDWQMPEQISEKEFRTLRAQEPSALRALAGFGCSFGGRFFEGYARNSRGDDYLGAARRGLAKKMATMQDVTFMHGDYQSLLIPDKAIVYCDPPYRGTKIYTRSGGFDHEKFWQWAAKLSGRCTVYVSELEAPDGWKTIWSQEYTSGMRRTDGSKISRSEKLFTKN